MLSNLNNLYRVMTLSTVLDIRLVQVQSAGQFQIAQRSSGLRPK